MSDEYDRRAREFIDDVLRINAEHGMRSVEDEEEIDRAVANVARWARQLDRLTAPTSGSSSSTAPTSTDALQESQTRRSEPTICSSSSPPTDYDDDPFVSDSYLRYHEPPTKDPTAAEDDGWRIGDHVEVGSVWRIRRARNRQGVRATGHIEKFTDLGVVVRFDCGLVNGVDWCTASHEELTRITDR